MAMSKHQFLAISNMLGVVPVEKLRNAYEYTPIWVKALEKLTLQPCLVANVKNVKLFEDCFGLHSTSKFSCSMECLNSLMSFATTRGLFICMNEDGTRFVKMKLYYNLVTRMCKAKFHYRGGSATEMMETISEKITDYRNEYKHQWKSQRKSKRIEPLAQELDEVVDHDLVAGTEINVERKLINKNIICSVLEERIGPHYADTIPIGYIERNICNDRYSGAPVSVIFFWLMTELGDMKDKLINEAIELMGFQIPLDWDPDTKIKAAGNMLQELYDNKLLSVDETTL